MRVDECYQLGYIVKTHGLKGEVTIQLDVDNPGNYQKMESVFLEIKGNLVPFFISRVTLSGSRATVQFKEVNSIDEAKELKGCRLFLPIDQLPDLPKKGYYYHDLVGYEVWENDQKLGTVLAIYQPSSQYLAAVDIDGKEVLIPIDEHIVFKVDQKKKKIEVKLPEGLIDIYR